MSGPPTYEDRETVVVYTSRIFDYVTTVCLCSKRRGRQTVTPMSSLFVCLHMRNGLRTRLKKKRETGSEEKEKTEDERDPADKEQSDYFFPPLHAGSLSHSTLCPSLPLCHRHPGDSLEGTTHWNSKERRYVRERERQALEYAGGAGHGMNALLFSVSHHRYFGYFYDLPWPKKASVAILSSCC